MPLVLILAAVAATAVSAQPDDTALCERIAAHIRDNRAFMGGQDVDVLDVLTAGATPVVELASPRIEARTAETDSEIRDLLGEFDATFGHSQRVDSVVREAAFGGGRLGAYALRGSDLGMITTRDGTANCATFRVFRGGARPALLAPIPKKGDHDGDNLICGGFGQDGNLVRIGSTEAFIEIDRDAIASTVAIRVVQRRDDGWRPACWVDISIESGFRTTQVFRPAEGPFALDRFASLAAQIAEDWFKTGDHDRFEFGPPIPDSDRPTIERLRPLVQALSGQFPQFGRDELDPFHASFASWSDAYPLVLDGRSYVVRVGHPGVGWRESPDVLVVLYTWDHGQPQPLVSALVARQRGAVEHVAVRTGR
jgi:hypothetical protein